VESVGDAALHELRRLANRTMTDPELASCSALSKVVCNEIGVGEISQGERINLLGLVLRATIAHERDLAMIALRDDPYAKGFRAVAASELLGIHDQEMFGELLRIRGVLDTYWTTQLDKYKPKQRRQLRAGVWLDQRAEYSYKAAERAESALLDALLIAITTYAQREAAKIRPRRVIKSVDTPDHVPRPDPVPTEGTLGLADILGALSGAAETDPMAQRLLAQIKAALPVDDQWLDRLERLHRMQQRAGQLSAKSLSVVQKWRAERANPNPWRSPGSTRADVTPIQADFLLVHADLAIFMMRQGFRWLSGDSEAEQEARAALRAIYACVPFYPDNDAWLTELLAQPEAGKELVSVKLALHTPSLPAGPDADQLWQQFIASCKCESDDQPAPSCQVHALIRACDRYNDAVQAILTHQLAMLDAASDKAPDTET
jgi:hypothetical protein